MTLERSLGELGVAEPNTLWWLLLLLLLLLALWVMRLLRTLWVMWLLRTLWVMLLTNEGSRGWTALRASHCDSGEITGRAGSG